jgi:hypothetical protein
MTQALYELVLDPLQTTYVDLLLLHHAGRFEQDKNPHPPCFDATLANAQGTYYNCRCVPPPPPFTLTPTQMC